MAAAVKRGSPPADAVRIATLARPWKRVDSHPMISFSLALFAPLLPIQDDPEVPPVRSPVVAASARGAAGFAPRGWAIEAQRTGDLNGDRILDLLLVLQSRDPVNVITNERLGVSKLDTNPRLLVVATGRRGGGFARALVNETLIPRWTNPQIDDAFPEVAERLAIRRGAFVVPLHFFANAGTWTMFNRSFTFRLRGGRAELIGFDENNIHRGSGEVRTTSINYLTGVRDVTTGRIDDDGTGKRQRTRLRTRPPLTIEQVGDGLEFDLG